MKYLNRFDESNKDLMSKIVVEFSKERVDNMLSDEKAAWVPDYWSDDYESEEAWYDANHNEEAQDIVINNIIGWVKRSGSKLTEEEKSNLYIDIKNEYNL